MKQFMWLLGGLSTAAAAWMLYKQSPRRRPMPVAQAAEQLQHAWANHHTEV